jgi:hypothetical protein
MSEAFQPSAEWKSDFRDLSKELSSNSKDVQNSPMYSKEKQKLYVMEPSKVALPATTEDGNSPFPENKMKVEGLLHTSDIKFDPTKFIKSDPFETIKLRYDEVTDLLKSKHSNCQCVNGQIFVVSFVYA